MPKLAVYIHIPKCSGTSVLLSCLEACPDRVLWHGVNADISHMQQGLPSAGEEDSYIYGGHFTVKDVLSCRHSFQGCDIRFYAHLRDPQERALSYYSYISRTENHPSSHVVGDSLLGSLKSEFGTLLKNQPQSVFLAPEPLPEGDQRNELIAKLVDNKKLYVYRNIDVKQCLDDISEFTGLKVSPAQARRDNCGPVKGSTLLSCLDEESCRILHETCIHDRALIRKLLPGDCLV